MQTSTGPVELVADDLYQPCDLDSLGFETTADLAPLEGVIGQPRAVRAIEFGLNVVDDAYHLFVVGPPGSGRTSLSRAFLQRWAAQRPAPDDWVYVHNFDEPDRPRALRLPPGRAAALDKAMEAFLRQAGRDLPRAFEGEEYAQRRRQALSDLREQQEALAGRVRQAAQEAGFTVEHTPAGIATIPLVEGKPLSREDFEGLTDDVKQDLEKRSEALRQVLEQVMRQQRDLARQVDERIRRLNQEVASFAVGHLIDELREQCTDLPDVRAFLDQVQEDLPEHLQDFLGGEEASQGEAPALLAEAQQARREDRLSRYRVNVFVDNGRQQGARLVEETFPTYYNLTGRVEYQSRLGTLVTDFRQIKAGALHRANEGRLGGAADALFPALCV